MASFDTPNPKPLPNSRALIDVIITVMESLGDGGEGRFSVSEGRVQTFIRDKDSAGFKKFRNKVWRTMFRNNWVTILNVEGKYTFFALSRTGERVIRDEARTRSGPHILTNATEGLGHRISMLVQTTNPERSALLALYHVPSEELIAWQYQKSYPATYDVMNLAALHGADLNYVIRGVVPARHRSFQEDQTPVFDAWKSSFRQRFSDAMLELRIRKRLFHHVATKAILMLFGIETYRAEWAEELFRGTAVSRPTDVSILCNLLNSDAHELMTGATSEPAAIDSA